MMYIHKLIIKQISIINMKIKTRNSLFSLKNTKIILKNNLYLQTN
jgi:hypothetical protein